MKRWERYVSENTPEYFDKIWAEEDHGPRAHFDSGRPEQLAKHVKAGDKVCDLGAGCWSSAQWLLEVADVTAEIYAVDFSEWALSWLRQRLPTDGRLHTVKSRAEETPFLADTFDVVMAGELIEHYEEPSRLVREMYRLCRPLGWLTVSTVDMRCDDAIRNGVVYPEHVWEFTPDSLLGLFTWCGDAYYWRYGNFHMVECLVRK